jgi:hypothetical protein
MVAERGRWRVDYCDRTRKGITDCYGNDTGRWKQGITLQPCDGKELPIRVDWEGTHPLAYRHRSDSCPRGSKKTRRGAGNYPAFRPGRTDRSVPAFGSQGIRLPQVLSEELVHEKAPRTANRKGHKTRLCSSFDQILGQLSESIVREALSVYSIEEDAEQ